MNNENEENTKTLIIEENRTLNKNEK